VAEGNVAHVNVGPREVQHGRVLGEKMENHKNNEYINEIKRK
jgi:hypothetical protein